MLLVECESSRRRLGLEAAWLSAVLPMHWMQVAAALTPPWAGWLEEGAGARPVLDLNAWLWGQVTVVSPGARILVPRVPSSSRHLYPCLLVERVRGVLRCRPEDFVDGDLAVQFDGVRCPTRVDAQGVLHWVPGDSLWRRSRTLMPSGVLPQSVAPPKKITLASVPQGRFVAAFEGEDRPESSPTQQSLRVRSKCWRVRGIWGDRSCEKLWQVRHCSDCDLFQDAAWSAIMRGAGQRPDVACPGSGTIERAGVDNRASLLVFELDGCLWAVEVQYVVEVTGPLPFHRIPRKRGLAICGIVQWRGSVLCCFSLREVMGRPEPSIRHGGMAGPRVVVIEYKGRKMTLPVDKALGVESVDRRAWCPLPVSERPRLAREAFRSQGVWVAVVDIEALFGGLPLA
ncbi:MAG: chemotaxis protein CheW [Verrucomicrobiota bacterium]|nr:chemotaxis protein CheW [Limisphaera sp.]MDW8381170.1 chemotaxis protein CheW [Verrucomicrobiota bacterium]